ncbi:hypothetical protein J3454_06620 [Erythrobacter sp. NFXS35]|uniref:hypothetical protein n=1 Tax=Erythrobacter sp. NFXS35 TaxID=2818436 RepID=UPI0032DE2DC7
MFKGLFIVISSVALSGCGVALMGASFLGADEMGKGVMGKGERRAATIVALGEDGNDLLPRYIEIEDVQKADGVESWTAETVIGNYRCTARTGTIDATCTKIAM